MKKHGSWEPRASIPWPVTSLAGCVRCLAVGRVTFQLPFLCPDKFCAGKQQFWSRADLGSPGVNVSEGKENCSSVNYWWEILQLL